MQADGAISRRARPSSPSRACARLRTHPGRQLRSSACLAAWAGRGDAETQTRAPHGTAAPVTTRQSPLALVWYWPDCMVRRGRAADDPQLKSRSRRYSKLVGAQSDLALGRFRLVEGPSARRTRRAGRDARAGVVPASTTPANQCTSVEPSSKVLRLVQLVRLCTVAPRSSTRSLNFLVVELSGHRTEFLLRVDRDSSSFTHQPPGRSAPGRPTRPARGAPAVCFLGSWSLFQRA